jgi:hypothetical protein
MMKLSNLEFRETQSYGSKIPCTYYEIVEWLGAGTSKQYCITVLSWSKGSEGWDIKFIGDRPFSDTIDTDDLWALMRYGNTVTNAVFRLEEYTNE